MLIVSLLIAIVAVGLIAAAASVRVVGQFERGVVFRFGQVRPRTRGPDRCRPAGETTAGSADDGPESRPTVAELLGADSRPRDPAAVNGTTARRRG